MPRFNYDASHDSDTRKPLHDNILFWVDANVRKILGRVFPEWPHYHDPNAPVKTEWQLIVRQDGDRGPIIGVIDLAARICELCDGEFVAYKKEVHFAFLVKTEIASLGELLREIQICRTAHVGGYTGGYLSSTPFIVVCPDDRHAAKLKEQGVFFFKYDPACKFDADESNCIRQSQNC